MLWSIGAGHFGGQLFDGVQTMLVVQGQEGQRKGQICRSQPQSTTGNRHGEKYIAVLICTSVNLTIECALH